MHHESTLLRLRAFRVVDRREGQYSRYIVLEDVERARFQTGATTSASAPPRGNPPRWVKAESDKNDAWNVLNAISNAARFPEYGRLHWPAADSIDAAIAQQKLQMKELWDQIRHRKIPDSSRQAPEPAGERSEVPAVRMMDGAGPSEEELQRMIDEVWHYAGGKQWKWKPFGRTPAGCKCEVLTFDGSEEVLAGPTAIEIPIQSG